MVIVDVGMRINNHFIKILNCEKYGLQTICFKYFALQQLRFCCYMQKQCYKYFNNKNDGMLEERPCL
ncbi:hypothetical protein MASR1M74_01520 [Lentimicrobium sp.]